MILEGFCDKMKKVNKTNNKYTKACLWKKLIYVIPYMMGNQWPAQRYIYRPDVSYLRPVYRQG